jgi:hypothetical protein
MRLRCPANYYNKSSQALGTVRDDPEYKSTNHLLHRMSLMCCSVQENDSRATTLR